MSDPTTTNTLASIVNQAIKTAMNEGESAAESAIIADVPWLGLPGIKQLLELGLNFVEGYLYADAAATATKIVIDLQIDTEVTDTQTAFTIAQTAIQSGDQSAIDQASKNLDAAFSGLIHSDGSAPT